MTEISSSKSSGYITLKAKQIQPKEGLKNGRNM